MVANLSHIGLAASPLPLETALRLVMPYCPSQPVLFAPRLANLGHRHWNLAPATVKVLDLLTNRYHVGVVRSRPDEGTSVVIELPRSGRWQVGQRVRFVEARQQALVARQEMKSARVTQVDLPSEGQGMTQLTLELSPQAELAA